MIDLEKVRRQLRATAADAVAAGATRDDLVADLLCVTRHVRAPGSRELVDAVEIAQLWVDVDAYALSPPF